MTEPQSSRSTVDCSDSLAPPTLMLAPWPHISTRICAIGIARHENCESFMHGYVGQLGVWSHGEVEQTLWRRDPSGMQDKVHLGPPTLSSSLCLNSQRAEEGKRVEGRMAGGQEGERNKGHEHRREGEGERRMGMRLRRR